MSEVKVWSAQQSAIFDWIRNGTGSAFVQARAGTGKTTTMVEGCRYMRGSIAFAAYGKTAARDIGRKVEKAGIGNNQLRTGTFHSFGLSAVRRVYSKALIDDRAKEDEIIRIIQAPSALAPFALKLCSLAKQAALGLYGDVNDESCWWDIIEHHDLAGDLEDPQDAADGLHYARLALRASNEIVQRLINFDDMIYLPAVNNYRMWANDWVVVDEAQDTNPARRALARKMLRPGGRAVFVGDDCQAIFGFTGADADAVEIIRNDFSCAVLPLTVTYRCPKAVVKLAQAIVPDIEAHPDAIEGEDKKIDVSKLLDEKLVATDAIICRKTAPLIKQAYRLIKAGIACHVEGREIGVGLLKLARRWKVKSTEALANKLKDYKEREVAKLMAKGRETQAEAIADRVETLFALMEGCKDLACVVAKIESMFQDDAPTLTLCTAHRSKGREWPRVYILGRDAYMPSPYARQAWQQAQEQNLIYVAITRAQEMICMVNGV